VNVSDGDTITVLVGGNRQEKVRFAQIDAPEKNQPFGTKSRSMLAEKIAGKQVGVEVSTKDRYGRNVAKVYLGDREINLEMVLEGGAWVYTQYNREQRYNEAERSARASAAGLWRLPKSERLPPWEWRRAGREGAAESGSKLRATEKYLASAEGCNPAKRTCKQMANCQEAKYYLRQCGLSRLDGDGDGVPCSALCR
tara:strand:- start:1087 stop:1677 length:591 start_codon:yes stop_codon:yes gene_type:complete